MKSYVVTRVVSTELCMRYDLCTVLGENADVPMPI